MIGKFYPPHRGHKYLIDTAAAHAAKVTIIVCHKPSYSIAGELRASWIREIHPAAEVILVEDTIPDDDTQGWADETIRLLGRAPDVVFTSEDYGDAYARLMGARHIAVDKSRVKVPVSGTRIRADPLANLDYLEPVVRAHFVKRVCVLGAESSGTTTLARALASHYATVWVPEYGRWYSDAKATAPQIPWTTEEFEHIAGVQCAMEDQLARIANKLLVCDTNAFATTIWHERYMGCGSEPVRRQAAGRRYDLHILTDIDIPFVQDGLRDGEHIRPWMHRRFEQALAEIGARYVLVSGSHDERMAAATAEIDGILAGE